jgi:hypothetical protein
MIKSISMIECFGVFSEVIAFVCIGSQFAAVRTSLPSHRRIGADAASARANEMGEASIARLVPPVSGPGITEGWELSLAPQELECLVDRQPKPCPRFDSSAQAAPHACRGEPPSCGTEEPLLRCDSRHPHNPAVMQTTRTGDPPRAAFVGANRLFAGLVLHQVRRRGRSVAAPEPRVGSFRNLNSASVSVPAPDARTVFMLGSKQPLTIAQAASPGLPLAPLETMLVELARRCLRSLAAKKRT